MIIAAIVITGLYVAREVLLPLALAILLSFVLTPALLLLRRLKVPRVIGVAIVVAFAFAIIFGLGWLMRFVSVFPSQSFTACCQE